MKQTKLKYDRTNHISANQMMRLKQCAQDHKNLRVLDITNIRDMSDFIVDKLIDAIDNSKQLQILDISGVPNKFVGACIRMMRRSPRCKVFDMKNVDWHKIPEGETDFDKYILNYNADATHIKMSISDSDKCKCSSKTLASTGIQDMFNLAYTKLDDASKKLDAMGQTVAQLINDNIELRERIRILEERGNGRYTIKELIEGDIKQRLLINSLPI